MTSSGSPHPTRSHFAAQDYMETGAVGPARVRRGGWLEARALFAPSERARPPAGARAVGEGAARAPRVRPCRVHADARGLPRRGERSAARGLRRPLRRGQRPRDHLGAPRARRLAAPDPARRASRLPGGDGARYPKNGRAFREVAALIKASVGLRAAWIDLGGWDTHRNQGNGDRGELAKNFRSARELARGVARGPRTTLRRRRGRGDERVRAHRPPERFGRHRSRARQRSLVPRREGERRQAVQDLRRTFSATACTSDATCPSRPTTAMSSRSSANDSSASPM